MDIACPQCSTTYTLDPQLLPPGGAPVQCTRCNHTFTAMPPAPAVRHPTAAYGTVLPEPVDAQAGRTATTEYGSQGTQLPPRPAPAAAGRAGTQVMGAVTPAAGAPSGRTQMMGAVAGPPPRSGTQQMGAVAAESPRTPTQMMGTVVPEAPRASTQMMGTVVPEAPRASTQQMGVVAPGALPPRTATQAMGAVAAEGAAPRASTQTFGAAHAPTQTPGAVEAHEAFAPPRTPTQAFGALSPEEALPPEAQPAGTPRAQTFLFPAGGRGPREVGVEAQPLSASPSEPAIPEATLPPASGPEAASVEAAPRGRVSLPEMPLPLPVPATSTREVVRQAGLGESSGSRRGLLWAAVLGVVALGAWGAWRAAGSSGPRVPPEAQLAREEAVRQLRRDDGASREKALTQLEALVASQPGYVEAQADLVQALALALSDARLEASLYEQERDALGREVARLEQVQTPGDWQNRVNALKDQASSLDRKAAPRRKVSRELERRLTKTRQALPAVTEETPPAHVPSLVRAQAFAEAVTGSPQVLALTERYRQNGGKDGWDVVAYAEYLLSSPAGPSGASQARESLAALKAQDASFLRAYLLDARLALLQREPAAARSNLDALLTLNPEHALARLLLAQVRQEQQAADAE